jgi:hypothetical protein
MQGHHHPGADAHWLQFVHGRAAQRVTLEQDMKSARKSMVAAALCASCLPAMAAAVQLQFEGLTVTDGAGRRPDVAVDQFYNGGVSRDAVTNGAAQTGPNLGIVFTGTAITTESQVDNQGFGDTFRRARTLLLADGTSVQSTELGTGALYARGSADSPSTITMDIAGGFNDSLSFFYNAGQAGGLNVSITSVSGGTTLTTTNTFPSVDVCVGNLNNRCNWAEASMTFLGLATRVTFSGLAFDFLIDNITLNSVDPRTLSVTPPPVEPPINPIPEPSTYALMALGLAAVVLAARRRQRAA